MLLPSPACTARRERRERAIGSTRVRGSKSQLRGEEEKELGRKLKKNMDEARKHLCKKAQGVETLVILHVV